MRSTACLRRILLSPPAIVSSKFCPRKFANPSWAEYLIVSLTPLLLCHCERQLLLFKCWWSSQWVYKRPYGGNNWRTLLQKGGGKVWGFKTFQWDWKGFTTFCHISVKPLGLTSFCLVVIKDVWWGSEIAWNIFPQYFKVLHPVFCQFWWQVLHMLKSIRICDTQMLKWQKRTFRRNLMCRDCT